ncbi:riboflavin synthase [Clostridium sp.]|uniref:riboflavin synthase n=1 Tax=Clostridium sp. TaxID=1506 RepID=UPI0026346164|nr:riboflavin synthase [Clostridium sp.]
MFTGIIEEVGILQEVSLGNGFGVMQIKCNNILDDTKLGDSIATNGVCLTVKEKSSNSFKAEVMGETLAKSNLGSLKAGDKLNLERALRLSDRLGGHIVSGHIDGVGKIIEIKEESNGTWFTISAPKDVLRYVIYKGSIGIDGISLTVAYVDDEVFKVSVIPHTLDNTILPYKKVNSIVNLECDLVGKYIEKLFNGKNESNEAEKSNITMDFLKNSGF